MYESPIEKIIGQIQTQMVKNDEENMMVQVQQSVGYAVNKEELLKALQYDREQYRKGYSDAMAVLEDRLDKIRAEIESNMESIIGKYDSSIPKSNMPSYKIERNKVRKECISIIDKYKAESENK